MSLSFYHGVLSASDSSRRLKAKGPGYYLLRMSDVIAGEYILSYLNSKCNVIHLVIPTAKRNSVIGKNQHLTRLEDVVMFVIDKFSSSNELLFQLNAAECQDDPPEPERRNKKIRKSGPSVADGRVQIQPHQEAG